MRNPAVHLVGIAASPPGGEIFGSRAEEELRQWLEARLDALGIDPIAYSRFVLSLLRRPDSALSSPEEAGISRGTGRRIRARSKSELPINDDRDQRRAVVQCLTSAADNEREVEPLVDELCVKLKELEGGSSNDEEESKKPSDESKTNVEALTPRDRALKYYAAFPALQSVSIKKFSPRKERNSTNYINNKNNGINLHNNKNNKVRNKKTRVPINLESQKSENKDSCRLIKSMEKEKQRELDQWAQLRAKFDKNLKKLWDSPGNAQGTASIWAASTHPFPSLPLWPPGTTETILTLSASNNDNVADTPHQESLVNESSLIPWDIDLITIEDAECSNKNKEYDMNWSYSIMDRSWYLTGIDSNLTTLNHNPQTGGFFPMTPRKTPIGTCKESRSSLKVNSLPEPDEDLLTSARTHFRPIKDDGHWADGTTFPVNNTVQRVAYRRSQSGHLLYLPDGESPYMEYRENDAIPNPLSKNLTLKFRVRQCDKCIQTDPIRSPVRRKLFYEQDRFHYTSVGAKKVIREEPEEDEDIEKDFFPLNQIAWIRSEEPLYNDRKRRHSSSFGFQPLTTLRPLTL